ncbi:MAG: sigma-70 family RNA polymerase sigma factor [Bacillota bacterium]
MAKREVIGSRSGESFEDLYRRYYPGLVRRLTFLVGERAQAEELAQEAFLKLYAEPPPRAENLPGWLLRVGGRLALNALRGDNRRRRREEKVFREEHREAVPLEDAVMCREAVRLVRRVLDELTPRDRLALLLRHTGFTYQEIAAVLDVAPGSVGTILARAQSRFLDRYRFEGRENGEMQ